MKGDFRDHSGKSQVFGHSGVIDEGRCQRSARVDPWAASNGDCCGDVSKTIGNRRGDNHGEIGFGVRFNMR